MKNENTRAPRIRASDVKHLILCVSQNIDGIYKCLQTLATNAHRSGNRSICLLTTPPFRTSAERLQSDFGKELPVIDVRVYPRAVEAAAIFELVLDMATSLKTEGNQLLCDFGGASNAAAIAMALAAVHHRLTTRDAGEVVLVKPESPGLSGTDTALFRRFDLHDLWADEQARVLEQQERMGRLEMLARVAPVLAHEIKNPLNLIAADLHLLRPLAKSARARELLDEIGDSVRLASGIITHVQQTVRSQAELPPPAPLAYSEVINRLLLRTEKKFPRLVLSFVEPSAGVSFRVSPEKLYSLFTNLIDNAARATQETGTIHITHTRSAPNRLLIHFRDNGPGVPEEFRDTLFDRGVTGNPDSGTGLGLNIVRALIQEDGGNIEFDPTYHDGAGFVIELPIETTQTKDPT